jgi:K+-sensing histidine kinase KdpD
MKRMIAAKKISKKYILSNVVLILTPLALVTTICFLLFRWLDISNVVMLYLFLVFLIALKLGRIQAVISSALAVLLFDFFFVPPQFSFAVEDVKYFITFLVMILVTKSLDIPLEEVFSITPSITAPLKSISLMPNI